jgi:hypothetical protein
MNEMIEHKKEYFFSFDRIHKELKHLMSQNYDDYKIFSELDLLCGHYLGRGRIGYYDEVEWYRFGITTESLSKMMILIGYPTECLKVLVYFRDHPHDILGEDVDDAELKEFEMTCCKGIHNYMKPIMEEKKKGGAHVLTKMEAIEHGDFYKWEEQYDISKWGKGYQVIAAQLPHPIDDDPRSDIIRPFYILNLAAVMHQKIIFQMQHTSPDLLNGDVEGWLDIDDYVLNLNKQLASSMSFFTLNTEIPATQILFALSLFLLSSYQFAPKEPYLEVCEKLQKYLLKYITDNYNILSIVLSSRTHKAKQELANIGNEEFYRLMEIPYVGTFKARDRSAYEVAQINKTKAQKGKIVKTALPDVDNTSKYQFVINITKSQEVINKILIYLNGKSSPRDVMMPIRAAIDAGVIRRPTYGELQLSFPDYCPQHKSSVSEYTNPNKHPYIEEAYNAMVEEFKKLV